MGPQFKVLFLSVYREAKNIVAVMVVGRLGGLPRVQWVDGLILATAK